MVVRMRPEKVQEAVERFWAKREEQSSRLADGGRAGGGARANGHLAGFEEIVSTLFVDAGIPASAIKTGRPALPGYYRVAKQWDLAVVHEGHLVAAIEFKSQVGSVGKNYNNRFEEALGSATDVSVAQQEFGAFGRMRPWLAYVFVLQENEETEKSRRLPKTLFPTDPVFAGLSYSERYQAMITRFLDHKVYQAGWFLTTKRLAEGGVTYDEPLISACAATFAEEIIGRVNVVRAAVEAEKNASGSAR